MRLVLKNIGKIRSSDISIDGITVIAGENDTGKSTIAKTLFVLCDSYHNRSYKIYLERLKNIGKLLQIMKLENDECEYFFPATNEDLNNIATFILDTKDKLLASKDALREKIVAWLDEITDGSIERPLKLDDAFFTNILEKVRFNVSVPEGDIFREIVVQTILAEFVGEARCLFNDENGNIFVSNGDKDVHIVIDKNGDISIDNLSLKLMNAVYIDNLAWFSDEGLPHQMGLAQYFQKDFELNNAIDELITNRKLALVFNKISNICKGDIVKHKAGNWFYSLNNLKRLLPIDNLSVGVRVFSIIKFLIKNGAIQENSLLILDEPETHLHPAWQIVFAEVIVLLYKYLDVRFLLNTHSPYFLHAIEVYSAHHGIVDKCKYYLSQDTDGMSETEDVTTSVDKIYKKLLAPIQELYDVRDAGEEIS